MSAAVALPNSQVAFPAASPADAGDAGPHFLPPQWQAPVPQLQDVMRMQPSLAPAGPLLPPPAALLSSPAGMNGSVDPQEQPLIPRMYAIEGPTSGAAGRGEAGDAAAGAEAAGFVDGTEAAEGLMGEAGTEDVDASEARERTKARRGVKVRRHGTAARIAKPQSHMQNMQCPQPGRPEVLPLGA